MFTPLVAAVFLSTTPHIDSLSIKCRIFQQGKFDKTSIQTARLGGDATFTAGPIGVKIVFVKLQPDETIKLEITILNGSKKRTINCRERRDRALVIFEKSTSPYGGDISDRGFPYDIGLTKSRTYEKPYKPGDLAIGIETRDRKTLRP